MNVSAPADATIASDESASSTPPESAPIAVKVSKKFRDLTDNPVVLAALDRVGFVEATPVQLESLPFSLNGEDLMLQAKTGSGKTLAFALPILSMLAERKDPQSTSAIILAPTRELASQICEVFRQLSPDVKPCLVIGGLSIAGQIRDLKEDPRVVVGTPGRILDLLRQKELSLRDCKFFAVDEVDEMFSMDFAEDVRAILSRLPAKRQGIFVSATISPKVEMLANNFLTNPRKIVISSPGEELPPVEHLYLEVNGEVTAKATLLCDLIETYNPRSALVFCNTKSDTELMEAYLRRRGYDARLLNSDLSQRERDRIMSQMRSGELRLLVGTDLAARGLDIAELDLVVNYALPDQPEVYVHRTGRTGRAGRSGRAISLVGPQDFMAWMNIKRFASIPITQLTAPSESELITARVAHLHAILRDIEATPQPKDMLVAQKFLADADIESPSEEFTALVAKLTSFALEQTAISRKMKLQAQDERSTAPRNDSPNRERGDFDGQSSQQRERPRREGGDRGGNYRQSGPSDRQRRGGRR